MTIEMIEIRKDQLVAYATRRTWFNPLEQALMERFPGSLADGDGTFVKLSFPDGGQAYASLSIPVQAWLVDCHEGRAESVSFSLELEFEGGD